MENRILPENRSCQAEPHAERRSEGRTESRRHLTRAQQDPRGCHHDMLSGSVPELLHLPHKAWLKVPIHDSAPYTACPAETAFGTVLWFCAFVVSLNAAESQMLDPQTW